MSTGSGALALTAPDHAVAVEGGEQDPDLVVEGDPRHLLAPAGDGAAEAGAKERQHPGQRAALAVEDDTGPHPDDA